MIVFISKENKDNLEAQYVLSWVTSIQVKQLYSIRLEEQTFNKVKQVVLHNKSVLHFSLKKN